MEMVYICQIKKETDKIIVEFWVKHFLYKSLTVDLLKINLLKIALTGFSQGQQQSINIKKKKKKKLLDFQHDVVLYNTKINVFKLI